MGKFDFLKFQKKKEEEQEYFESIPQVMVTIKIRMPKKKELKGSFIDKLIGLLDQPYLKKLGYKIESMTQEDIKLEATSSSQTTNTIQNPDSLQLQQSVSSPATEQFQEMEKQEIAKMMRTIQANENTHEQKTN